MAHFKSSPLCLFLCSSTFKKGILQVYLVYFELYTTIFSICFNAEWEKVFVNHLLIKLVLRVFDCWSCLTIAFDTEFTLS